MDINGRCGKTIEGPVAHGTRNAVTWRKYCKRYPLKGYGHCKDHLSFDERDL